MSIPEKIIVPFEYDNDVKTSFYSLELLEYTIDRVALNGILDVLEAMEPDIDPVRIAFWEPARYGWDVTWRMTGQQFLDRHELKEIKSD